MTRRTPKLILWRWLKPALIVALSVLASLAGPAAADSSEESAAVILVAAPGLVDAPYRHTVIIAAPVEGGRHIGIIVNRPTRRTLSSLFPDHAPSKAVVEPVFFGGPMSQSAVFALARNVSGDIAGSLRILKDLSLAINVSVVDRVIEQTPNDARFYVGNVMWRPGELYQEIRRGVWNVLNADLSVVFTKDPEHLWQELSAMARGIMADAGGIAGPERRTN